MDRAGVAGRAAARFDLAEDFDGGLNTCGGGHAPLYREAAGDAKTPVGALAPAGSGPSRREVLKPP